MSKEYLKVMGKDMYVRDANGKSLGLNQEYRDAYKAYGELQKALKGGASEADIYKLTKTFEAKASAMTDAVEKKAWEKGLTDEQTAAIR
jgi:hypothetical protein